MGSVNANPVRLGQNAMLANPTPSDLWLPVFGGEVLTWFEELNISSMLVRIKTIMSGSTSEFPLLHQFEAERHAIGTEMLGQDLPRGVRTLSLDDRPLVAPYEVDDIDRLLAHFDDRQEMAQAAGRALAREMDRFNFRLILNASRTAADGNSPFPGGGFDRNGTALEGSFPATATGAWSRANIIALLEALEDIQILWAEHDIPENDRGVIVPFKAWFALRNLGMPRTGDDVTLRDWSMGLGQTVAGSPQYSANAPRTNALSFNGLPIWGSNHLPNGSSITTGEAKYQGDFTKTRAIMVQKEAVGHLTLLDVVTETDRDVRRGVDFFVTKVLTGGGTLRPEAAVELAIA